MSKKKTLQELRQELKFETIYDILEDLDASPQASSDDIIISQTICHKGDSHKLYYYHNTGLFNCYSGGCGWFDIFHLVGLVKGWEEGQSIRWVFARAGMETSYENDDDNVLMDEFEKFFSDGLLSENSAEPAKIRCSKVVDLLPHSNLSFWKNDGISDDVIKAHNIKYHFGNDWILIPHYNFDNQCVGIRIRDCSKWAGNLGKYRPLRINGKMYNHPLSTNLYGIEVAKDVIRDTGVAVIFEGEKSPLQFETANGYSFCVAACGMNISRKHVEMLIRAGAKEMVIALDKEFENINSPEYEEYKKKLEKIYKKYNNTIICSFIIDKEGLLDYKDSPTDKGNDIFKELYKNRIVI